MEKIEIYADAGGEYRWRYRASNGAIMADSAEGYGERNDAVEAALQVFHLTLVDYLQDVARVLLAAGHTASYVVDVLEETPQTWVTRSRAHRGHPATVRVYYRFLARYTGRPHDIELVSVEKEES